MTLIAFVGAVNVTSMVYLRHMTMNIQGSAHEYILKKIDAGDSIV